MVTKRRLLDVEYSMRSLKILFMGSDNVAVESLKALSIKKQNSKLIQKLDVLTGPDRKFGRNSKYQPLPVKQFAMQANLDIYHTPENKKSLKKWTDFPFPLNYYDVGVVVSFGHFLYPPLLNQLKLGAINMHPSLLPKVCFISCLICT